MEHYKFGRLQKLAGHCILCVNTYIIQLFARDLRYVQGGGGSIFIEV